MKIKWNEYHKIIRDLYPVEMRNEINYIRSTKPGHIDDILIVKFHDGREDRLSLKDNKWVKI